MNSDDVSQKIGYIQQANGFSLNIEERAALQSSLLVLKRNGKFSSLHFWGKLFGIKKDFLLVQGYGENLLKGKKTFASYNGVDWVQLPDISSPEAQATRDICKKIRGRLVGDLSHEYQVEFVVPVEPSANNPNANGKPKKPERKDDDGSDEDGDEDDEDEEKDESQKVPEPKEKKIKKTVTEEKRLAYIVDLIDHDTSIVPRGALTLDASHVVHPNITFAGLQGAHATQLKSYVHFRQPETASKRSLLQKEGLSSTLDFLDTLDEDIPKGCWALQEDKYLPQITIRSLVWPGFYFYHIPSTSTHGHVYFGHGDKNVDLGFML